MAVGQNAGIIFNLTVLQNRPTLQHDIRTDLSFTKQTDTWMKDSAGLDFNIAIDPRAMRIAFRDLDLGFTHDFPCGRIDAFMITDAPDDDVEVRALQITAQVGDELYFHGGMHQIMIWSPDVLFAMGPEWDSVKSACRARMAEFSAKAARK